jgi:prepilin-type N-terminal cleavage/methylation domain-containing protein
MNHQRGFSFVELIVALALSLAVTAMLFEFAATSQRVARTQPEAADATQRLRVAAAAIERDLRTAGAAPPNGSIGTLTNFLPPIVPARTGLQSADAELTAFSDRVSVLSAADAAWTARVAADLASPSADIPIASAAVGCPAAGLCGFTPLARAAILDTHRLGAGFDVFTVTHATTSLGHSAPNPPFAKAYPAATSVVIPVEQKVYYLDRPAGRLMVYDGYRSALPFVDHVDDLEFTYFVDPHPQSVAAPGDDAGNCAYAAGIPPIPLLMPLGETLVQMPLERFADGPFCGLAPNRFDADLLRIRRVGVRFRLRSTAAGVRGLEVAFQVAPRNIVAAR